GRAADRRRSAAAPGAPSTPLPTPGSVRSGPASAPARPPGTRRMRQIAAPGRDSATTPIRRAPPASRRADRARRRSPTRRRTSPAAPAPGTRGSRARESATPSSPPPGRASRRRPPRMVEEEQRGKQRPRREPGQRAQLRRQRLGARPLQHHAAQELEDLDAPPHRVLVRRQRREDAAEADPDEDEQQRPLGEQRERPAQRH